MADGWLLVQAAAAEQQRRERADALRAELGGGAELVRTEDADALREAVAGHDGRTVVTVSGDGGVHVLAATLRDLDLLDEVTVGICPAGTGDDLAGSLGVPDEVADVAALLRGPTTRALDLLDAGGDGLVVNAAHLGLGVAAAERATPMKDAIGDLAYPLGALLAGYAEDGAPVTVTVDGEPVGLDRPALMVVLANAATIGGGHAMVPGAVPDDGLLDVLVVHATGPAERVAFGGALLRGTHVERDDVVHARGRCVDVEVAGEGRRVRGNVDGELVDLVGAGLVAEVVPAALTVVCPAG